MMVEPFFPRPSDEADMSAMDATKANGGEIFQSFDGIMDDLFALSPSHTGDSSGDSEDPGAGEENMSSPKVFPSAAAATLSTWRDQNSTNAVHMYAQENSKLPTLNFPVDRKKHNSSPPFAGDASKLAESFLSSSRRQSYHANYQQAGALSQTMGTSHHAGHHTRIAERRDSLDADVLEAFLADIDPTPLSEIKKRHAQHHQKYASNQATSGNGMSAMNNLKPSAAADRMYTRKQALPIPTKRISPPQSPESKARHASMPNTDDVQPIAKEPMQSALATAAALAAARPKAPPPSTSTSIHRASDQKARYGFGSNHVVPSIPNPPPSQRPSGVPTGAGSTSSSTARVVMQKRSGCDDGKTPTPVPSSMNSSSSNNKDNGAPGDAYERKKQRAKDARIKLNESIERLSVAIALAGTQSRERRQQWQELPDSPHQETSMQIMADCIDTADSAKKWDRPAFVGSAASLIQGLNAQCETMMREIMRLREENGVPGGLPPLVPSIVSKEGAQQTSVPAEKRPVESCNVSHHSNGGDSGLKRRKVDESSWVNCTITVSNGVRDKASVCAEVFGQQKLVNKIAGFLDPLSLLQCQGASKSLQTTCRCEDIWSNICALRFGFFNVRQWRAKFDDEDEGVRSQSCALYRSMDRANVMASFQHEGLFLLGEARLPNKVSAWVFLVERSNGETMRSVRRRPDMPGTGTYTTLPIVELRTVMQNTGIINEAIIVREQAHTVDASTRRRGEEMKEVDWDDRFKKRAFHLDGTPYKSPSAETPTNLTRPAELCRLRLFDSVVMTTYIHAKGCSTNSKFVQRANFTKILVALDSGVTVPLVVPFPRDASHLQH